MTAHDRPGGDVDVDHRGGNDLLGWRVVDWARGSILTKLTVDLLVNPVPVIVRGCPPSNRDPMSPTTLVTAGTIGFQFQLSTVRELPQ